MIVDGQVTIAASRAAVWRAITDIEHAADVISGIQKVELLAKPAEGLVGLTWRETRLLFGKPASAEKRITDAKEQESYTTRAEDSGFVFVATLQLTGTDGAVTLTSRHDSIPQGFLAKLQAIPMTLFFKGVARKALQQDLDDIKAAVERA